MPQAFLDKLSAMRGEVLDTLHQQQAPLPEGWGTGPRAYAPSKTSPFYRGPTLLQTYPEGTYLLVYPQGVVEGRAVYLGEGREGLALAPALQWRGERVCPCTLAPLTLIESGDHQVVDIVEEGGRKIARMTRWDLLYPCLMFQAAHPTSTPLP